MTAPERNYCVTRRELLAVLKSIKHFRPYLYGKTFRLRTDHASLRWLCRRTDPSDQVARWLELLAEFKYTIEHRAGPRHGNADGLSRQGCSDCRQCQRIEKRDGGPSREELEGETKRETSPVHCGFCSCSWQTDEDVDTKGPSSQLELGCEQEGTNWIQADVMSLTNLSSLSMTNNPVSEL